MDQIYTHREIVENNMLERYQPSPDTRKIIVDSRGREELVEVKPFEELPPEKEREGERYTKHFFFPDLHYPDHNQRAYEAVMKFARDFKPDVVHIMGDWVNFTTVGKFPVVGEYNVSLGDEIRGGRELLRHTVHTIRESNPDTIIRYYEGNHESRLEKYLARNADALKDLTDIDGENILTVPHLFHLKDLGVEWYEATEIHREDSVSIEHGNIVRQKSGYTANGMLDRRGNSGFSGHTHRLALVTRNQGENLKFWVECGSLCNLKPTPTYAIEPDWANGFVIGVYDKEENIMHPQPILIQKDQFYVTGFGQYKGNEERTP